MLKQLRIDIGQSNSNPRCLAWLANLLRGEGGKGGSGKGGDGDGDGGGGGDGDGGGGAPAMVDSFAAFRAHLGRATAWSQYTNGRYSNLGAPCTSAVVGVGVGVTHTHSRAAQEAGSSAGVLRCAAVCCGLHRAMRRASCRAAHRLLPRRPFSLHGGCATRWHHTIYIYGTTRSRS